MVFLEGKMDKKVKVQLQGISKTFHLGKVETNDVQVVFDVNLNINEKEFVIICGPSGSGKSTILNILIGLESPTKGKVFHDDIDIYDLSQNKRAKLRLKKVGVVLQQSIWLKSMPVLENVAMPYFLTGHGYNESMKKAMEMLVLVNMASFIKRLPSELSDGQQQKIAIARALINDPEIIVADEPTGNLDTDSSAVLMDELSLLNKKYGKTIVMVTHDLSYLKLTDRNYYVKDGHLHELHFAMKDAPDSISKIEEMIK